LGPWDKSYRDFLEKDYVIIKSGQSDIFKKKQLKEKDQGKEITLMKSVFVSMLEPKSSVIVSATV